MTPRSPKNPSSAKNPKPTTSCGQRSHDSSRKAGSKPRRGSAKCERARARSTNPRRVKSHTLKILHGDCLEELRALPEASIDSIVTDPPYGLSKEPDIAEVLQHWLAGDDYEHRGNGFMGKAWDSFVPGPAIWREALRVLKPGGHLLAFAGTRTVDLMGISLRIAGFEIRDQIAWHYATGMPKSHNVSKAIDKAAGKVNHRTIAHRPEAQQWEGWGTALKPASEPIIVARKPLSGTVAANVLEHGTGAINVDGCRISYEEGGNLASNPSLRKSIAGGNGGHIIATEGERRFSTPDATGRWPANVIFDETMAAELDEQSGIRKSGANPTRRGADKRRTAYGEFAGQAECRPARGADSGGASRFFFVAKPSGKERDAGLEHLEEQEWVQYQTGNGASGKPSSISAGRDTKRRNIHTTVKPIELMRYLCRLVTPPGGTVLDPFAGSGTTGCAVGVENNDPERQPGWSFIGIEREAEYVEIAEARIKHWSQSQDD